MMIELKKLTNKKHHLKIEVTALSVSTNPHN